MRELVLGQGLRVYRSANTCRGYMEDVATPKGRTLTPEQKKKVVHALRECLQTTTQTELAEAIGYSQSQISAAKEGRGVSLFFANALANYMETGLETFVPMMKRAEASAMLAPVEIPAKEFIEWLYGARGVREFVDAHPEVTLQDLIRLRATPLPDDVPPTNRELYRHVRKLRTARNQNEVPGPQRPVDPDDVLRPPPTSGGGRRPGRARK